MVSNRRLLILVAVAAFLLALTATRYVQGGRGAAHAAPAAAAPSSTGVPTVAVAPSSQAAPSAGGAAGVVVADVVGAVRRPGVVRLAEGARVGDAIRAAGGATRRGDLASVNLAAHVADGAQIVVRLRGAAPASPPAGAASAPAPSASTTAGPVSLSSADAAALESLPGVGPATAQKIIDYRAEHGSFQTVDELLDVPGIGPAKLEALRSAVVP